MSRYFANQLDNSQELVYYFDCNLTLCKVQRGECVLRVLRIRRNLTMKQVSQMAGITESYYCLLENGLRHPSVPVAKKLGAALGFDWSELFEENEKEPPKGGGEE